MEHYSPHPPRQTPKHQGCCFCNEILLKVMHLLPQVKGTFLRKSFQENENFKLIRLEQKVKS